MINHARNLLLNQDGVGFHGYAGEEYTPPTFHAATEKSFCLDIRRVLFGQQPDWLMRNYRAYELMRMLHATELAEFVLDLDPRITYDLEGVAQPFAAVFPFARSVLGSTAVAGIDGTTTELTVTSDFKVPDILGQCYQQWEVELTGSQFRMTHQTKPRKLTLATASFSLGLSDLVRLPETTLQFRTRNVSGSKWRVESYTRPQRHLGDLEESIAKLGNETFTSLFHVGDAKGNQEPWQTFRHLWEDHNETPYRLGAVVLALIYHTHDTWNVG